MTLVACTWGGNPEPVGIDDGIGDVALARPGRSTLDWRRCGKPFECATLRVPLNHARPGGRKLGLAIIRLKAPVHDQRLGSLVVNPGGPGGSRVQFVRHGAVDVVPAELRAQFDIVGFDPRAVGTSAAVSCGGASEDLLSSDLHPDSPGEVAPLLTAARRLAGACGERNGPLLRRMSTEDVARDVDLLREALGDRQLTYLGYSYGTFIGATYASLFAKRTRALVLDGAVDPSLDAQQRARQQAEQLERTLDDFLAACDTEPTCPLGRTRVRAGTGSRPCWQPSRTPRCRYLAPVGRCGPASYWSPLPACSRTAVRVGNILGWACSWPRMATVRCFLPSRTAR
ncbi:MAG: alpha/beta hydrolase [Actinomycetota bacterium]|nr:alpha/beta hydrolase [Actinomycetota bacterium]